MTSSLLTDILWILGGGFFSGEVVRRAKIPPLVAMIIVGIILGSHGINVLTEAILQSADSLRVIAVMVILMKAGLGLDRQKLVNQGTVALKLGFLPASCEAIAVTLVAIVILDFDWSRGLLLGCILGAESPAVIVPQMLRLKSLGWGVKKGIPDAILTGSALSDVLLLLVFSLLMAMLTNPSLSQSWLFLPFQVVMQVSLGLVMGWASAKILVFLLIKKKFTQNAVQDTLVSALLGLFLVVFAENYPFFSGYLGVMSLGFFIIEFSPPLARRLRGGFDTLWKIAEIFLFVLLGANIPLGVLGNSLGQGLIIIAVGTLIGRMIGWYLSTLGSNWNLKEKLFLLPGNSAKATVQAAIGAIPLAWGIVGGEEILAIAALSILVTAPLGAWGIPTFAPKLLEKGEVDATKVSVGGTVTLLCAIDETELGEKVLIKSAEIARRSDAEVVVVHISQGISLEDLKILREKTKTLLADINHRFIVKEGSISEEILGLAQEYQATEIILGQKTNISNPILTDTISQTVLETSTIPVMLVK